MPDTIERSAVQVVKDSEGICVAQILAKVGRVSVVQPQRQDIKLSVNGDG